MIRYPSPIPPPISNPLGQAAQNFHGAYARGSQLRDQHEAPGLGGQKSSLFGIAAAGAPLANQQPQPLGFLQSLFFGNQGFQLQQQKPFQPVAAPSGVRTARW